MENVLIDIRGENEQLRRLFNGKDLVSVEDLLDKICDLDDELQYVEEQFEDYKNREENNYDPNVEIPNVHYDNMIER